MRGNVVVDNGGHGIDVRNCRDVILQDNTVARNAVGIFTGGPDPASFTRDVSPLSEQNAGPSVVSYQANHVFGNNEDVLEE